MFMTRTFHPIGQGAFYSEKLFIEGEEFTIVYDCGSLPFKPKTLENKVCSAFPKGHTIDILFVSHFDADHINGIPFLNKHYKIKRVVLPLLDKKTRILAKVSNYFADLASYEAIKQLIEDTQKFFGDETILIKIAETEIGGENPDQPEDISGSTFKDKAASPFSSGTRFFYKKDEWSFIPFNYKYRDRHTLFLKELKSKGLELKDLDPIEKIPDDKKDLINSAYKKVGGLNENSMILYSGKRDNDYIHCFWNQRPFYCGCCFNNNLQSGCLYFGDVDLNQGSIIGDIKIKLHKFLDYIGTIQVPHHGSIGSFNNSFLIWQELKIRCAIFSFGVDNIYGHPSPTVVDDIISHGIFPFFVTEKQDSIVIERRFPFPKGKCCLNFSPVGLPSNPTERRPRKQTQLPTERACQGAREEKL